MHSALLVVTILVILIGIGGTVLPLIPGIPLIFLAIAAYGWYDGFHQVSPRYLIFIAGVTILSIFVEYLASYFGAKYAGSSKGGVWGSIIGFVIGFFVFPPFGLFIGPWVGAYIGEIMAGKHSEEALKTSVGVVIGLFSGIAFKLVLGVVMLISFLIIVF